MLKKKILLHLLTACLYFYSCNQLLATVPDSYISDGHSFSVWDNGWQLPAVGQGVVTFTVSASSLMNLNDIKMLFSPVLGIAGTEAGGVDTDNFGVTIGVALNATSKVYSGYASETGIYYYYPSIQTGIVNADSSFFFPYDYAFTQFPYFSCLLAPLSQSGPVATSYDFKITIDEPHSILRVEARTHGAGDYTMLFEYTGRADRVLPTNSLYFSFGHGNGLPYLSSSLSYTDITVSTLPSVAYPTPPTGYVTSLPFEREDGHIPYPTWHSGWQLPAPGQGIISFTVAPAFGLALHDIMMLLSPYQGIAGGGAGGSDSDNIQIALAAYASQVDVYLSRGIGASSKPSIYYEFPNVYYYGRIGFKPLQGSTLKSTAYEPALTAANTMGLLLDASVGVSYNVKITVDTSRDLIQAEAKRVGDLEYELLFVYESQHFALPTGLQYFSLSHYNDQLTYTDIAVSPLPGYVADDFPTDETYFTTWDNDWALPETGRGLISFTATPASGQSLHDVRVAFSPSQAISGTDEDNLLMLIGGWNGYASAVIQGNATPTFYYYWKNDDGIRGGKYFQLSETRFLSGATTNVAYDFQILLDAPNNLCDVYARVSGVGSYQKLFSYVGALFNLPTNAAYFSLSNFSGSVTYSSISVAEAPALDTAVHPPLGYTASSFPQNHDPYFTKWHSGWQLPEVGSGIITFRVTPASGQTVHDVMMMLSPVQGIAGGGAGGSASANFWMLLAGRNNTGSLFAKGWPELAYSVTPSFRLDAYNYWFDRFYRLQTATASVPKDFPVYLSSVYFDEESAGTLGYTLSNYVPSQVNILENAPVDMAYDFRVTLDRGQCFVDAKKSTESDYRQICGYPIEQNNPLTSDVLYFSFSNRNSALTFSNITVTSPVAFPLDGRRLPVYLDSHYTFSDGERALGAVFFTQGFTVPAGARAYVGITKQVDGPIDLNETGQLCLLDPLELGDKSLGFVNGGIISTRDGQQGFIMFDCSTQLTRPLIFRNSTKLVLGNNYLDLRSDADNRGALTIENTLSQTLELSRGSIIGVDDFAAGYAAKFRAIGPNTGVHTYLFKDMKLQFLTDGVMTATKTNIIFSGFDNRITAPIRAQVTLNKSCIFSDFSKLTLDSGVELHLDANITASCFDMGHAAELVLNDAVFTFNKPLNIPSSVALKDIIPAITVEGSSVIKAAGTGDDTILTIGGEGDYDHNPFVNVSPASTLMLNNVNFVNNNSVLGR